MPVPTVFGVRRVSGQQSDVLMIPPLSLEHLTPGNDGHAPSLSEWVGGSDWPLAQAGSVYPPLQMEYGGPYTALARELRQSQPDFGTARLPAAKAMEQKAKTIPMAGRSAPQQPVVWQNPYLRGGPVELTQKTRPTEQQPSGQRQTRVSDAEIRRVADKVFRLVEERIVTERRRIGR